MKLKLFIPAFFILMTACGLISGGASGNGKVSNFGPDADISADTSTVTFNVAVSEAVYKRIPLNNNLSGPITIDSVLLANNVCANFTIDDVWDAGDHSLGTYGYVNLIVPAGKSIKIIVKYQISSCIYTSYQTTLWVYYNDGRKNYRSSIILSPVGGTPPSSEGSTCDEDEVDESLFPPITVAGIPEPGEYFIRVDRMASYIFPRGSNDELLPGQTSLLVGTDIGVEPNAYTRAYLPSAILPDVEQNFSFNQITSCARFILPSPPDDNAFGGAKTEITSTQTVTGILDASGNMTIQGLTIILHTRDIPRGRDLVADPTTRQFRIGVSVPALTTGQTTPDRFLSGIHTKRARNSSDEEVAGDTLMTVFDNNAGETGQTGSPLHSEGKITLVGRGTFIQPPVGDFIGASTKNLLIDIDHNGEHASLIYVQIEATLTKKTAEEE